MEYLKPTDSNAFQDLRKLDSYPELGYTHECPTCKGHGYWNLRLNAYPRYENPADRHFKSMCGTCNGYGYTESPNPCAHDWANRETIGRCLHRATCSKCGMTTIVDSSD